MKGSMKKQNNPLDITFFNTKSYSLKTQRAFQRWNVSCLHFHEANFKIMSFLINTVSIIAFNWVMTSA